eukprot:TRINITY_DN67340_c5_g1_i1.p1 TRINITY_DN67340_c5_g1~~TRINITY_DN67340_c5_g1_i1.p1  ORF type:complete len:395 (+),score=66.52 TRINITY_DN67340_c5_g1_i1:24-1187(+)
MEATKVPVDAFYSAFADHDISFFTGVPDSLLADFLAYVTDTVPSNNHIIAANEGASIGIAAGYHLATGKVGCVYMQNSGFGNALNPLLSLADPKVYEIPMLLLVGWRGEPGIKDEPQHSSQGAVQESLLQSMGVPYEILPSNLEGARSALQNAAEHFKANNSPYVLLIRKATFSPYTLKNKQTNSHLPLSREEAIKIMLNTMNTQDIVVSTTGYTSREVFEHRAATGGNHEQDFLTVGCMGHSSAIAMGIALQKPDRNVICFDGDGAMIMHMGTLSTIGQQFIEHGNMTNFKHVIINNNAHDSVGGQPTAAKGMQFSSIAKGVGYRNATTVEDADQLQAEFKQLLENEGPALLEIMVRLGARKDLGRPTKTPIQNKTQFMAHTMKTE